jgi:hypothetical protein
VRWPPCLHGVSPHRDALLATWTSSRRRCQGHDVDLALYNVTPPAIFFFSSLPSPSTFHLPAFSPAIRRHPLQLAAQQAPQSPCAPFDPARALPLHRKRPARRFFIAAGSSAAVVGSLWPGHSGELLVQPSSVPSSQWGRVACKLDRGSIVAPEQRRATGPPWPWASLLRSLNCPTG